MPVIAEQTVCLFVIGVSEAIVKNLWRDRVENLFPKTRKVFMDKMVEMKSLLQFPCCFGAIDGYHIPIKCPACGRESNKEYQNFKNFYSLVLMIIVDSHYRFIWASCGFPGTFHDSVIFQSTHLYSEVIKGNLIHSIAWNVCDTEVQPVIFGDSAFPFKTWLLKPYTNIPRQSLMRKYESKKHQQRRWHLHALFCILCTLIWMPLLHPTGMMNLRKSLAILGHHMKCINSLP